MTPYVITVTFQIRPGCAETFLSLIRENARRSLLDEPGCRRFDVLLHPDANQVFLYEIYDDEHAFVAHCASPHFKMFDRDSRDLCETKAVQRYTLIQSDEAEMAS